MKRRDNWRNKIKQVRASTQQLLVRLLLSLLLVFLELLLLFGLAWKLDVDSSDESLEGVFVFFVFLLGVGFGFILGLCRVRWLRGGVVSLFVI